MQPSPSFNVIREDWLLHTFDYRDLLQFSQDGQGFLYVGQCTVKVELHTKVRRCDRLHCL